MIGGAARGVSGGVSRGVASRLLCAVVALALVAGCTSSNEGQIARSIPIIEQLIFGPDEPDEPPRIPTRAELNQIPFATIAIRTAASEFPTIIVPVADNRGYLTYQDQTRRSVVLLGGLLTATNGLGYDLSAVKHQIDDPVVVLTPLDQWPSAVDRNYQFTLTSRPDFEITVKCTLAREARERIVVFEIPFDVTRVSESCLSPRRTFTNTYWAADNGFIWKSEQWAGPRLDPITIEIIRPYNAG